jgi:hypothetical protein
MLRALLPGTLFLAGTFMALPRAHGDDWLPVSQEDLALKDNPKHPGDHAMILYREIQIDEDRYTEEQYVRIKIFDETGKNDYGNWETSSYDPARETVKNISARTIHPDGSVVPFEGNIFEKVVMKYRSERLVAKTFSLPAVTPGSIIEVKSTVAGGPSNHHWFVQHALYQREAHFSLRPTHWGILRWSASRLPEGHVPVNQKDKKGAIVKLDIADMPGYEKEPFMLPEDEVVSRVDFFHEWAAVSVDDFWKRVGTATAKSVEDFLNRRAEVQKELARLLSPSDSSEVKLHKIYDRVQSLENLTYAPEKSKKELKREKENLKEPKDAEEVLRRGYGEHDDLNLVFLALAQGAGLDATPVFASRRNRSFFDKNYLYAGQFYWALVLVKDGGKEFYFDPGTRFCPFGVVPWEFTSVMGLRVDRSSGAIVTIPIQDAGKATVLRKAVLNLEADGTIRGNVELTFTGHEAMDPRLEQREADEEARRKYMEDGLRSSLPPNSTVELKKVNSWDSSNDPLMASYEVKIPGYATLAGHRMILNTAFFAGAWQNPFTASQRTNGVVFAYPYTRTDDVTIKLPPGAQIETLPDPKSLKNGLGEFSAQCKNEGGGLHATRQLRLDRIYADAKYYSVVRNLFSQAAGTQDEQAVVGEAKK